MSSHSDHVDFLSLLDAIQEFIVVKDGAGRWLFCNRTALAAYEMSGFAYVGITDAELLTLQPKFADGFARNMETDELAWQNRSAMVVEKSFMGQDGRINTLEVIKTPSFNADGTRYRLLIVSRNITERKLAEKALQASEERFKSLAYLDVLTGIANRRGILDLIACALDRAATPLSTWTWIDSKPSTTNWATRSGTNCSSLLPRAPVIACAKTICSVASVATSSWRSCHTPIKTRRSASPDDCANP
jgi:PAS domain S-box-containing protein